MVKSIDEADTDANEKQLGKTAGSTRSKTTATKSTTRSTTRRKTSSTAAKKTTTRTSRAKSTTVKTKVTAKVSDDLIDIPQVSEIVDEVIEVPKPKVAEASKVTEKITEDPEVVEEAVVEEVPKVVKVVAEDKVAEARRAAMEAAIEAPKMTEAPRVVEEVPKVVAATPAATPKIAEAAPSEGDLAKQRETAAKLARQKVLEAYGASSSNFEEPNNQPKVDSDEWKKYHSAWQDYYQKYYGNYYNKVAKDYVEREKIKYERTNQGKKLEEAVEKEIQAEAAAKGIRARVRAKATERARKARRSKHFIPLVIGALVILAGVLLQYNQVIFANVAAYVTPGGGRVNEILAIDSSVMAEVGPEPLLIIPKLNVVVPVVFGAANDTVSMNNAMHNGVAHFSVPGASAMPGEIGNFAVSGHSAGNVYRASDFKFVFSGLERLVEGDLIYMNFNSVRYTYSVTRMETVLPSNVASLTTPTAKPIMTLITCTPLGTSRYRLLVFAEQISPSFENAGTMEPMPDGTPPEAVMPSNDPSPLEQFWNWLTGNA
jgi:sortase A